jgi:hypothetical protein
MVKQAANLLDGTSAEDLRRDPETRRNTEKSLTEIQASVATLCVKDAPKRKFKLDGV